MYPGNPRTTLGHVTIMEKGKCNTSILLAGRTGVGRSTLINMITGATDGSTQAAKVSNDVRPYPIDASAHTASLEVDGTTLSCSIWDTRGLDEAVDHPNLMEVAVNWLRQQGFGLFSIRQSEHDLRDVCRKRVNDLSTREQSQSPSVVILMWCIHASKIDVPIHWQHFRKVYVEYCNMKVKPVVVITQMTAGFAKEWKRRCWDQLEELKLGIGFDGIDDLLLMVRKYRDRSSPEYLEDSLALKKFISKVSANGRA